MPAYDQQISSEFAGLSADLFRLSPLAHKALYRALLNGFWPYQSDNPAGERALAELLRTGAFALDYEAHWCGELVIIDAVIDRALHDRRIEDLVRHACHSARLLPEDCATLFYRLRNGKWPWAVVDFDRVVKDGIRARLREAQFTKGGAPYLPGIRAAAVALEAAEEVRP